MIKEINIDLRAVILSQSLKIEKDLSDWLKILFRMHSADLKTLGSKGSALSFRNKTDLLYDLDHLTKPLYKDLILFMEIRNQLIHNIDSNTLLKVFEIVNSKKRVLEVHNSDENVIKENFILSIEDTESEKNLRIMEKTFFMALATQISNGIINSINTVEEEHERKQRQYFHEKIIPLIVESINEFSTTIAKIFSDNGVHKSNLDKIIPTAIGKILKEKLNIKEEII